jgi:hypothetical protein
VAQNIHVAGRPEWVFVKVHTHGAPEKQADSLLGGGGRALHRALARYNDGQAWALHYVTAREMYNVGGGGDGGEGGGSSAVLRSPPAPAAGGGLRSRQSTVDSRQPGVRQSDSHASGSGSEYEYEYEYEHR